MLLLVCFKAKAPQDTLWFRFSETYDPATCRCSSRNKSFVLQHAIKVSFCSIAKRMILQHANVYHMLASKIPIIPPFVSRVRLSKPWSMFLWHHHAGWWPDPCFLSRRIYAFWNSFVRNKVRPIANPFLSESSFCATIIKCCFESVFRIITLRLI